MLVNTRAFALTALVVWSIESFALDFHANIRIVFRVL